MPTKAGTAVALIAAAALTIPAAPASAATVSDPLVEGLIAPLGLAVDSGGTLYVAEAFGAGLSKFVSGEDPVLLASPPPDGFIPGVALDGQGSVVYTVSGGNQDGPIGQARRVLPNGESVMLGDTAALELRKNSDRRNRYGFKGLRPSCAANVPADFGGGKGYKGEINPNAYAVAAMGDGSVVVADAGGNALVRVENGRARTLAVLPPVPITVTEAIAEGLGLAPCVIGSTYYVEPVPTDVEVGPDGMLYVSSLAGGPEDPALAALLGSPGGVFQVNPQTGRVTRIARGFLGAVDLAVAPDGTVYVAELFGGQVSKITNGGPELVAEVSSPGALEWANGMLYVTVNAFPPAPPFGSVVTITP